MRDLPPIEDAYGLIHGLPEVPEELVQWILHRGSKMVIGGGSKTNKTWILTDLAISVACGVPWLDFLTKPSRVLFVNLEIQRAFFARRLSEICKAKDCKIIAGCLDIWNLRGHAAAYEHLLQQIEDRIKEAKYSLIILDPIYKILGDADENSANDIGKLMNRIEGLANASGTAVAFGAHFSKGNQARKQSIDRISGSGVFARDPDAILTLTHHKEEGAFVLDATLRNHPPIQPFVVRWQHPIAVRDGHLDPTDLKRTSKAGRSRQYCEEELLAVLAAQGATGTEWLAALQKDSSISKTTFYELLKRLSNAGKVKQTEDKWKLV